MESIGFPTASANFRIRLATPSDYEDIISVLNDWWGGRQMSDMLPKLFFVHFRGTTFVLEQQEVLVGFLAGLLSQTFPDEAYIHFVGIHPDHRKRGAARMLYEHFFDTVRHHGRSIVRCMTSPVNKASIAFHQHMGFAIEPGDVDMDGISVHRNCDGRGQGRVLFVRRLE